MSLTFPAAFPDTIWHIQGPVLPHPGTSTSTSRDQYFHIWGPVLLHLGPVLSHPDQYSHLQKCLLWFYPGTSPACEKSMTDQNNCATLYQSAVLFIPWKYEILVNPLFKSSISYFYLGSSSEVLTLLLVVIVFWKQIRTDKGLFFKPSVEPVHFCI